MGLLDRITGGDVLEPDVETFIRNNVPTIWVLEVLLALRDEAPTAVARDALVQQLRATPVLIKRCLAHLARSGLIEVDATGARFAPHTPELEAICLKLAEANAQTPIAVRDAIIRASDDSLLRFSDAARADKASDKSDDGGKKGGDQ
jgi:hypothetical protein